MTDPLGPHCGCVDCEAAVSPGAYLTTLCDYVLKHVRNNFAKIDLPFLKSRFHQPFAELPLDCEAMEKKVHQVRLAVEVLHAYLGVRPLPEPAREKALSHAEAEYRLATYTQLLTFLGTTYEEVRRGRSAGTVDRAALAEQIGIDLTPNAVGPREDELDRLLLDAALPSTDERALTERSIERVFGLGDTRRDPLSEGVKYGDAPQQVLRWNFDGAYWDRNTDAYGLIHLGLFKLAADNYVVQAFSDAARSRVVASGERKTPAGPIRLVPESGSGLSGSLEIDYTADDTNTSISLVPSLVVWRQRHLRTLWERADWPVDSPAPSATAPLLPIIDPQVVGLKDLRSARPGDPAFDLWLTRFNWLNAQRSGLKAAREAAPNQQKGMETIIAQALSTPARAVTVADLDTLEKAQQLGERIEQRVGELNLTPGAFAFLLPLVGLVRAGQPVVENEWEMVYDTLLRARKQIEFTAWRAKEQSLKLTLSPNFFRAGDNANGPELATGLAVPFWLSTREVRRDWMEVLESRITQEAAITAGIESAVSSAEETTLPLLRAALLMASDVEGSSLQDRAEWLTQRLLIDFRMSGLQLTTRVAQAIETLQEMLFSLRSGQLEQDTLSAIAPLASINAVAQGGSRIDLFGRGEDDVLWHRVWDGTWRSWRSLGPLPGAGMSFRPSDPVAVARGGGVDLVIRGSDRVLWHRRLEQTWSDWTRVEGDLELVGNPAVTLSGPNVMDVFALRVSDLQVMQRHYDGTNWTAWVATGATSSRVPAATSWGVGRLDLFLGRRTPDLFKPLHRWWDGAAWQEEPLDNVFFSDPVAASWDINRLDLFQNFSGHLWQKTWNGAWQPWVNLDATLPPGAPELRAVPSVYSVASGTLDVFSLRSGNVEASVWRRRFAAGAWSDWEVLPSDQLTPDAPDFDAEWTWIGSYSTFRGAMFVHMYPENLLEPSLIPHQTPAFRELAEQSRPTKRLTPKEACLKAQIYSNYLREVSSLDIEATCQVKTPVDTSDPCKTPAPVHKDLLYMFGRTTAGRGGKVYWSAIDPLDRSGYAQSFWEEVPIAPKDSKAPAPKVLRIIGALPWLNRDADKHHIYLFLDTDEPSGRKLRFVRFNLDLYRRDGAWEGPSELTDLPKYTILNDTIPLTTTIAEIPVDKLTILPVQSNSVSKPPALAIHAHAHTHSVYFRALNETGDGWAGDKWPAEFEPRYRDSLDRVDELEAALCVNDINWLVYKNKNASSHRAYATSGWNAVDVWEGKVGVRGALPGAYSSVSSIFVFYDADGQTVYRDITHPPAVGTTFPQSGPVFITTPSLKTLAPHSGSLFPTFFVMKKKGTYFPTYAYRCQAVAGELVGSAKFQVIPLLSLVTNFPIGESMTALQSRRVNIQKVYEQNKLASASILTYLVEAYRLVPQQLALNMQSSGEYVAALDWFRTVYDYRAPQGKRYIDYGLAIDAGLPETAVYRHAEDWLLDPLNPHAVALTRRNAYTRFTITSIIRCLNAFADAEFTYDTGESLVRARLLYTTALELCDVPELRQSRGTCEAIIGALEIQPGVIVPPAVAAALGEIVEELTQGRVTSTSEGLVLLEKMKTLALSGKEWAIILTELNVMKTAALKTVPVSVKTGLVVVERPAILTQAYRGLLTDPAIEKVAKRAGEIAVAQAFEAMDEIREVRL